MGLYAYRHVIANERICFRLLHRLRWPNGVQCPVCHAREVWAMHERGIVRYRCKVCRRHFSIRTGTVLARSQLPLTKWVLAVGLFKVGISARALAGELHISRRIAWALLHRIRDALATDVVMRPLSGEIELDDTYIGARRKGKRGRGAAHKTIVLGLKVRHGPVRSLVIPSLSTADIHALLRRHVAQGARLYTDELPSYNKVRRQGYRHRRVLHNERFIRGQTHTQGIEGHWGHVKPTLVARHRAVSPRHLQRYLVEADVKHRFPKGQDFIAFVLTRLLANRLSLPTR